MGEIIQSTQNNLAEAKYYKLSVYKQSSQIAEVNRVLEEFHTVDNVILLIRITSCP